MCTVNTTSQKVKMLYRYHQQECREMERQLTLNNTCQTYVTPFKLHQNLLKSTVNTCLQIWKLEHRKVKNLNWDHKSDRKLLLPPALKARTSTTNANHYWITTMTPLCLGSGKKNYNYYQFWVLTMYTITVLNALCELKLIPLATFQLSTIVIPILLMRKN